LAELILTLLDGSVDLAERMPGFGDPFDVARACQHLAGLDLADTWNPPHLPYIGPADIVRDDWEPPTGLADGVTDQQIGFDTDGVIVVLGTSRLGAAEESVRAAPAGEQVTVAVVTDDPAEIGRLVRLRIGDLGGCLRRVFGSDSRPALRLVLDEHAGTLAAALGIRDAGDTEAAVRVQGGTIIAKAHGRGAGHAVATVADRAARRPDGGT
jgi:hypothetical protein